MTSAALVAPSSFALAGDKTEIVICHGTGSQGNPYVVNSPAINSSGAFAGELAAGHNDHVGPLWFPGITETWGDIIPPYDYEPADFHFAGLNWTAEGQAIYNNGCNIPQPSPSPTPTPEASPTPTPEASPTPTPEASPTPTPEASPTPTPTPQPTPTPTPPPTPNPTPQPTPTPTPQPTPTPEPTPTPTGSVLSEVGTPKVTLPPTDTLSESTQAPAGDSWRLILLAMAGILTTTLLLTPAPARARRKDR